MGRNSFKKEKTSFNGGQHFHFRCVYLNIAEGKFFCSEINVLILWYSRVRAFPQKRIEGYYLTKKKNNYCWVLPSCNILFFVFQFLCNILTHVLQAKRQKKYVQIPNFFFLFTCWEPQLLRSITDLWGSYTAFPSVARLLFEKDFTKVKWTSCYSKHPTTVKANIVTGR